MTIDNTLNERGARYGDFTDHAAICDALISVCGGIPPHVQTTPAVPEPGTVVLPITQFDRLDPVKKQAIRVICDKLARILSPHGDPEYRDNWHDIQGYAKLAEDRCKDGDAKQQAELPLDPIMPELRDVYSHRDGSRECRPVCQHGVVEGGNCFECGGRVVRDEYAYRDRQRGLPVPGELDPRDGA